MNKMILIGGCLIGGAVIYGVADYLKTDKKQLKEMYTDGSPVQPPAVEKPAIPVVEKMPIAATATNSLILEEKQATPGQRRRRLNASSFSRAALKEFVPPDSIAVNEKAVIEVKQTPDVYSFAMKRKADSLFAANPALYTRKKISLKYFSRAPLEARYLNRDTVAVKH